MARITHFAPFRETSVEGIAPCTCLPVGDMSRTSTKHHPAISIPHQLHNLNLDTTSPSTPSTSLPFYQSISKHYSTPSALPPQVEALQAVLALPPGEATPAKIVDRFGRYPSLIERSVEGLEADMQALADLLGVELQVGSLYWGLILGGWWPFDGGGASGAF